MTIKGPDKEPRAHHHPKTALLKGKPHEGMRWCPPCIPRATRLRSSSSKEQHTVISPLPPTADNAHRILPVGKTQTLPFRHLSSLQCPPPFEGPDAPERVYLRGTEMQHITELSLGAVQARGPLTVQTWKININNYGCQTKTSSFQKGEPHHWGVTYCGHTILNQTQKVNFQGNNELPLLCSLSTDVGFW